MGVGVGVGVAVVVAGGGGGRRLLGSGGEGGVVVVVAAVIGAASGFGLGSCCGCGGWASWVLFAPGGLVVEEEECCGCGGGCCCAVLSVSSEGSGGGSCCGSRSSVVILPEEERARRFSLCFLVLYVSLSARGCCELLGFGGRGSSLERIHWSCCETRLATAFLGLRNHPICMWHHDPSNGPVLSCARFKVHTATTTALHHIDPSSCHITTKAVTTMSHSTSQPRRSCRATFVCVLLGPG